MNMSETDSMSQQRRATRHNDNSQDNSNSNVAQW